MNLSWLCQSLYFNIEAIIEYSGTKQTVSLIKPLVFKWRRNCPSLSKNRTNNRPWYWDSWPCKRNPNFASHNNSPFHGYLFSFAYNVFDRGCEAISGNFLLHVFARNCLTTTFDYIVMQMRKVNCEKGYCHWIYVQLWHLKFKLAQRCNLATKKVSAARTFQSKEEGCFILCLASVNQNKTLQHFQ